MRNRIIASGFGIALVIMGVLVLADYALWGVSLGASAVIITITAALLSSKQQE